MNEFRKEYPDHDWNGWELVYGQTTFSLEKADSKGVHFIYLNVPISKGWDWAVDHVNGMIENGKLNLDE